MSSTGTGLSLLSHQGRGDSGGWFGLVASSFLSPHLWIAGQVRNDVTMLGHGFHPLIPCQALGQALVSSPIKGEGDSVSWLGLVVCSCHTPPLWIADQVRNDVTMLGHRFHPLIPCQALGQALVSSPIKGEGDSVSWLGLVVCSCHTPPLWIADQVRNDVTMLGHRFHPLIPCQALGQALVSSPIKGEEIVGWCCLVVCPFLAPHLWIADQVRNDVTMLGHRFSPSDPSVRHWDRPWFPLPSRERGFWRLVWSCCLPVPFPSPLDCGSSPQ